MKSDFSWASLRADESGFGEFMIDWTLVGAEDPGFQEVLKAWTQDFDWDLVTFKDYGGFVEQNGRIKGRTIMIFRQRGYLRLSRNELPDFLEQLLRQLPESVRDASISQDTLQKCRREFHYLDGMHALDLAQLLRTWLRELRWSEPPLASVDGALMSDCNDERLMVSDEKLANAIRYKISKLGY